MALRTRDSSGCTMARRMARRAMSARMEFTMSRMVSDPVRAARTIDCSIPLKVPSNAVPMACVACTTVPEANAFTSRPAWPSLSVSCERSAPMATVSVSDMASAIGELLHQGFKRRARHRLRVRLRETPRQGRAPLAQAHAPELVGREAHRAYADFERAGPGQG